MDELYMANVGHGLCMAIVPGVFNSIKKNLFCED